MNGPTDLEHAERAFDEELRRRGEAVRAASEALQAAQDHLRKHADSHDDYIAYKLAVYKARRGK